MAHEDEFWLALFEVLIPADAERGMPSAAMPSVLSAVRARLQAVPGMAGLVEACLDRLAGEAGEVEGADGGFAALDLASRTALVKRVDAAQPGGVGALAFNLYAVYYQQPEVLASLGLPSEAPFPRGFVLEGDDDDWFEKARARARRAAPQSAER